MAKIYVIESTEEVSLTIEKQSKQLKIRCLAQWYSQEGQDVGHGHKPREGNIYGEKYILNFVTERKSLLTGGKSVLAIKKIM